MNPTQEQKIQYLFSTPILSSDSPSPKKDPKITKCAKDDDEVKEEPVKEAVQNYTPNQKLPEARKNNLHPTYQQICTQHIIPQELQLCRPCKSNTY